MWSLEQKIGAGHECGVVDHLNDQNFKMNGKTILFFMCIDDEFAHDFIHNEVRMKQPPGNETTRSIFACTDIAQTGGTFPARYEQIRVHEAINIGSFCLRFHVWLRGGGELGAGETDTQIETEDGKSPFPKAWPKRQFPWIFISEPNVAGINQINATLIEGVGSLLGVGGFVPIGIGMN